MRRPSVSLASLLLATVVLVTASPVAFADKGKQRGGGQFQARLNVGQSMQRPAMSAMNSPSIQSQFSSQMAGQVQRGMQFQSQFQSKGFKAQFDPQKAPSIGAALANQRANFGNLNQKFKQAAPGLGKSAIGSALLPAGKPAAPAIHKHLLKHNLLAGIKIHHNHCHQPLNANLWCHYFPNFCHWWWHYCPTLHGCLPTQYYYWNWYYIPCPTIVVDGAAVTNARWYLGVSGMLLPGTGLGIDSVAEGSPAAQAGLQPGMVIQSVNGIGLARESDLQQAIATSNGVLQMVVIPAADQPPVEVAVQMVLVPSVSY